MSLPFLSSYVALWVLVILQGLVLLALVRMVHELRNNAASFNVGGQSTAALKPAPPFQATALDGTRVTSEDFPGRLTALLFVSPTCTSCTTTLHEMRALHFKAQGNVVVICRASRYDSMRLAQAHKLDGLPVIADEDDSLSRLYRVTTVPMAVLINGSGKIQSYGYPLREEMEQAFEAAPAAVEEERKAG
ncbi:MAG TPA: redoxin domain-containing protein [Thermoanaerobaculia bacterium]